MRSTKGNSSSALSPRSGREAEGGSIVIFEMFLC